MRSPAYLALALLILLASLLLPACVPPAPPERPLPLDDPSRPRVKASGLEQRIHQLINQERRSRGLTALAWDDALARVARLHSRDMGDRRYFSHDSPEGTDFSERYRRGGYTCALRTGNTIHMGAENIFQNNLYESVTTRNGKATYDWTNEGRIAETTVRGWMESPGHRKNILTPHWKRQGIGVSITPAGKILITQNFC